VVGVDLGLNRPAVTSERHFLGSSHWKEVDRRRFRIRRKLPRDTQRDMSKRAEMWKVDHGEELLILCHTERVLR
jgi:hypothetical protein